MKRHNEMGDAALAVRRSPQDDTLNNSPTDPTGPRFRIEDIFPCVDGGRYAVKRIAGEIVEVWADIFREGHDVLAAAVLWRAQDGADSDEWHREPMTFVSNDRWHGRFTPPTPGWYLFAIEAWTDQYATWHKEFLLKQAAGQDVAVEAREGHELLTQLMPTDSYARGIVEAAAHLFASTGQHAALLDETLLATMSSSAARPDLSRSDAVPLVADRERARAGAWYEMVPRSQSTVAGPARHVPGLHRPPAGDRRSRLRRALSHADPSDRPRPPQGQEQCRHRAARRRRQLLCHRQ